MPASQLTLPDWPRVSGAPVASAVMRACAEDFRVDEVSSVEIDGDGEHLMIRVRKRNQNTVDVAQRLARHAGVKLRDIGYAGLKDRNAVTTQWFSVWLPGKPDPDWSGLEDDDLQILDSRRHGRKLQRGALRGNRFVLVLRDVEFHAPADRSALEQRLAVIAEQGVPNYFGEQRFGRRGRNLTEATAMFGGRRVKDRHRRGLYLSAARSFLFNEVLAARVAGHNWNRMLSGEALMLAGSRSFFVAEKADAELEARFAAGDVLASGPLWGRGSPLPRGEALALETRALAGHCVYRDGLASAGLKQERRALRLPVADLQWCWLPDGQHLQLGFELPAGCYATSVLRELVDTRAAAR